MTDHRQFNKTCIKKKPAQELPLTGVECEIVSRYQVEKQATPLPHFQLPITHLLFALHHLHECKGKNSEDSIFLRSSSLVFEA